MATTEPAAPLPETAQAPIEATPAAATPVPAEATPASPTDLQDRLRAMQAEITRQQQARATAERERDALKAAARNEPNDEEVPTPARPGRTPEGDADWRKRALEAEWQIARAVHGEDVIAAYSVGSELLNRAATPADYVNAFEAYYQARNKGATHQQAVEVATPVPAAPVVVDSNRSDGPLLTELDQKVREAAAAKDLRGWISAKLAGAKE